MQEGHYETRDKGDVVDLVALTIPCIHIKDTMWCATACCVMSIFLFIEFSIQVTMVILNIAIEKVVISKSLNLN